MYNDNCGRTNMSTLDDVSGLTNEALYKYIAGWKLGSAHRINGETELARRLHKPAARRSWIAIGISAASLAVSFAAFMN
jgi:hypothetical protein